MALGEKRREEKKGKEVKSSLLKTDHCLISGCTPNIQKTFLPEDSNLDGLGLVILKQSIV